MVRLENMFSPMDSQFNEQRTNYNIFKKNPLFRTITFNT